MVIPAAAEGEEDPRWRRCNTDCVYFLASPFTCTKGSKCEYRHAEGARFNRRNCWYWFQGNCVNPSCTFRHPRSSQTFRRSGSSGLVWDGRLMSEDQKQSDQRATGDAEAGSLESKELRHSRSTGSGLTVQRRCSDSVERSRSGNQAFRTRHVPPALDPPSPKVSRCLFCGIFSKEEPSQPPKPRR
ncbi:hypothetical protein E2562_018722 [Oryza meyeriana var. granulata]|uniref:C3H1-type domain-containing protein n=1 Tax=Oryza meyeriana var. granulata TaxID=110450 RepID=A0A6G1EMR6_9ORYZ|nr:hypothetical protein E2562_018722 [Oryza meyeriana var. granulata]